MSGESFFPIDHTQKKPVKGNFTQEQEPQPGENRSGVISYDDLLAMRREQRIAAAVAGLADVWMNVTVLQGIKIRARQYPQKQFIVRIYSILHE